MKIPPGARPTWLWETIFFGVHLTKCSSATGCPLTPSFLSLPECLRQRSEFASAGLLRFHPFPVSVHELVLDTLATAFLMMCKQSRKWVEHREYVREGKDPWRVLGTSDCSYNTYFSFFFNFFNLSFDTVYMLYLYITLSYSPPLPLNMLFFPTNPFRFLHLLFYDLLSLLNVLAFIGAWATYHWLYHWRKITQI